MTSGGAADRISALPDELLHHVLSFLPAHEVVWTCLLGRRWRNLWRSAPARVTGVKGCYNSEWFVNFVHTLLLLRDPRAQLDSFEIDLDERDFDFEAFLPENDDHVNTWFRHAVMCGPRVLLALRTTHGVFTDSDDYCTLQLLNVPLASHHLTRLELKQIKNDFGDCGNRQCYGCHNSQGGADDRRGESVLLKGLSEVAELELSADSKLYSLLS
ncbi:hypothetical protein QYE76_046203 [Lolium multiflorum]|uniref:F-box domain-containing protein n=1 Tax=Lolium multiflorum TaxID=4521 RepID=A0AAD8TLP9_LOLMU|nr:hypothetical protein QYE76_046203 [Lolium multiflorum]